MTTTVRALALTAERKTLNGTPCRQSSWLRSKQVIKVIVAKEYMLEAYCMQQYPKLSIVTTSACRYLWGPTFPKMQKVKTCGHGPS